VRPTTGGLATPPSTTRSGKKPGYYDSEEIRTCEEIGITVTLPKPLTSGAKAAGRFGKQDFVYLHFEQPSCAQ
jgi:hypothetical protein